MLQFLPDLDVLKFDCVHIIEIVGQDTVNTPFWAHGRGSVGHNITDNFGDRLAIDSPQSTRHVASCVISVTGLDSNISPLAFC